MFFRYFFTHFKWSKPGLKQNCEAFLSPINQDFLESYQYIAVADEQNTNHKFNLLSTTINNTLIIYEQITSLLM